ncbi:hypothetical protein GH714_035102 [Hevea brasiliensis]|uniref:Uncharacterized protein n=1 Tax=Hevea brasiliensis TaxID=3981 RepID=A0A6A6L777_HEVBR|nr:hypothetical protein GH714_035102 [Hevea brasiliensis]
MQELEFSLYNDHQFISNSTASLMRPKFHPPESVFFPSRHTIPLNLPNPSWTFRNLSHGTVNLVISEGKPKFERHEVDPPKKEKWQTKKRLKMQRMREKQKRKEANKRDPRSLTVKRKKKKFANAEERIKYKLERAKIKEALLIERLKRYEVPKVQGPEVKPCDLTGYLKKYLYLFGSMLIEPTGVLWLMEYVIMEMLSAYCQSPTLIGPISLRTQESESRMSIQIWSVIVVNTKSGRVFPVLCCGTLKSDSLSCEGAGGVTCHHLALEKSKYEQSLESVRHFITVAEKELELYYRHIALYGDPNNRNPLSILDSPTNYLKESQKLKNASDGLSCDGVSPGVSETQVDSSDDKELSISEIEDDYLSTSESDSLGSTTDWDYKEREQDISLITEMRSFTRNFLSIKREESKNQRQMARQILLAVLEKISNLLIQQLDSLLGAEDQILRFETQLRTFADDSEYVNNKKILTEIMHDLEVVIDELIISSAQRRKRDDFIRYAFASVDLPVYFFHILALVDLLHHYRLRMKLEQLITIFRIYIDIMEYRFLLKSLRWHEPVGPYDMGISTIVRLLDAVA